MEDVPSKYGSPRYQPGTDPLPRSMMTGSSCSHSSCIWVKGATDIAGPSHPTRAPFFCGSCQLLGGYRSEGDAGKPSAGAGAARIIRGALYFDNLGGSYYNEPILLKK